MSVGMSSSAPTPATGPRWLLGVALGLPVALVVGILIAAAALRGHDPGALALPPVPAPEADSTACQRLLAALPDSIDEGELTRRQLRQPEPRATAAWGRPPVVLRCGLARPAELTRTSRLLVINGVQFLKIPGRGATTWVAVDRPVYIAVTLPEGSGSGALQEIADAVRQTLPRRPVDV